MSAGALLGDLSARGIVVMVNGDSLELDAPAESLTDGDLVVVRQFKPDIVRLLRLAGGLPIDDGAARLLAMDEVDPSDLPTCPSCGRLCDVQTLDDHWRCSPCDPDAGQRRRRTKTLQRTAAAIRYIHNRNG